MARFLRTDTNSSGGHSRLEAPAVVRKFVAGPVRVTLAERSARAAHIARQRRAAYRLEPPPPGVDLTPPATIDPRVEARLFPLRNVDPGRRQTSRLEPPQVVNAAPVTFIASPVEVKLAASKRGTPRSRLEGPTVIRQYAFGGPRVRPVTPLSVSDMPARRRTASRLEPPQVVTSGTFVASPIRVTLVDLQDRARHNILQRRADSRLVPPTVIDLTPQVYRVTVTLAPSKRGTPKSHIGAPTVTLSELGAAPMTVALAPSRRVHPFARLAAPTVVGPILARPIDVTLARIRPARTIARVEAPVVIDLTPQTRFLHVTLAYSRRGAPKSRLAAPSDTVGLEDQGRIKVLLAPSHRKSRAPRSRLSEPAAIDLTPQTRFLSVHLAYSRRGAPKSKLYEPADTVGLEDQGTVKVRLAPSHRLSRAARAHLEPPVVIDLSPQVYAVALTLAPSSRLARAPHAHLGGPTVVAVEAQRTTILVVLAPQSVRHGRAELLPPRVIDLSTQVYVVSTTLAPQRRGTPKSRLFPPTDLVDRMDLGRIVVRLAPSSRIARATHARLAPPTVVGPVLARPISVTVTRIKPRRTLGELRSPQVVLQPEPTTVTIATTLAYQSRRPGRALLEPPTVIDLTPQVVYLALTLAPSTRLPRAPHARLAPPTVIDLTPQVYYLATTLTRIRPVPTKHQLGVPTDTFGLEDQGRIEVRLAPSPRQARAAHSRLFAPVDTVGLEDQGRVRVTLARIKPVHTVARLLPPTVVFPFVVRALDVTLAYQSRGKTLSELRAPVVVDLTPQTYFVKVSVTRIAPKPTVAVLGHPTVIIPENQVYFGPAVHLPAGVLDADERRRFPRSRVTPPVVIGPPIQFWGPGRLFARKDQKQRRRTRFQLAGPTVVSAQFIETRKVTALAPQRRGTAIYRLGQTTAVRVSVAPPILVRLATQRKVAATVYRVGQPAVVRVFVARPTVVQLAPQRRGTPRTFLAPPAVVTPFVARPTAVTLAPSSRGTARWLLGKPRVIFLAVEIYGPSVTLTRIRPEPTVALLKRPTVTFLPPFAPLRVTLTRIVPPPVRYLLVPPAVIGASIAFFGPQVTLTYQSRGKPRSFRIAPSSLRFIPPAGDVCGFDTTQTFICYDENGVLGVVGGDQQVGSVTGSDQAVAVVDGGDSSDGAVSGGDREAT